MALTAKIDTSKWDAIMRTVKGIGQRRIAVGVFGDEELATIAATHEYGEEEWHATGAGIPERSYLRSTLREKKADTIKLMKRLSAAYFKGKVSVDQAVGLLGEKAVSWVRAKIRSNIPPALKEATIKRKGSSLALVDTGRLLNAIEAEEK